MTNEARGEPAPSDAPSAAERETLAELRIRHRLWHDDAEARVLARGGENTTFAVGDYIVRFAEDRDATAREARLLHELAGATSVRVPLPVVHDPDEGLLIYRTVAGEPLLRGGPHHRRSLEAALTSVLGALRHLPAAEELPFDDYPNEAWHEEGVGHFASVRAHLDPDEADAVASFLRDPPPTDRHRRVAQHNDLGCEHILVDEVGMVTGIIDWTDAALTDPARDLGRLYRDLGPDLAFGVARALDGTPSDDERRRIRFHARCTWLEDYRHAIGDPVRRAAYLRNCRRTFDHTFRDA